MWFCTMNIHFIVYKCTIHIQSYLCAQKHTIPTCMVCFSPEQESVISTQYGLLGESHISKIPLMCLQDFPGDALVYPAADMSLNE